MATLNIDNKEYDLDTLSDECKSQLATIQFVEKELAYLQAQAAAFQTAKTAYLKALKSLLPVFGEVDTNSARNLTNPNQIKSPSQIDLNTVLEYYQKGRYDLAHNLATTLTKKYPKHPLGWKVLGALFKQTGKLQDSVIANQKVLEISPNDAEAHSNLGITLQELGRLEEAETSYKKAIAIKPDFAEAHSNLGSILQELGRLEEAESSYKKAIAIKPDFAEAHSNLGSILHELGRLEETETSIKKAIVIKPDYADAHSNLGNTLQELGRLQEAEESYNKAIEIKPDSAETHYNLGIALKGLSRLDDAEASFAQAIRLKPDHIRARSEMLTCLYLMDEKSLFFNQLDYFIKEDITSSVIGSLTCRSALRYGDEKSNIFCNEPLKYALLVDLKSRYDFEETFVRNAKAILGKDRRSNRRIQPLLSNGYQTSGNLFLIENNFTDEIQKAIRLEIERYRINFENSQEGLIRKWPIDYSLYGWLICMKSGGKLSPHIHKNGWLSGSIYINVPSNSKNDSGKLVVAIGEDSDVTNSRQNSKKVIDVVTGSMVLFPASLMHHTIPFESEEERIVLAFDVIPKSQ